MTATWEYGRNRYAGRVVTRISCSATTGSSATTRVLVEPEGAGA